MTDPTSGGLGPALPGEILELSAGCGRIALYAAGRGPPILLIHSINAAASSAEVRPIQAHCVDGRRVYCLDLPGFGLSERGDRRYTPRLMTDAVQAAAREIGARSGPGPIDALALSLSCEFLARAAIETPGAFRSLAFVSPTGFSGPRPLRGPRGSTLGRKWLYRLLRGPGWGKALFRGLTRPSVIRYFLKRTWGSDRIDEELWRYAIETAHQPGAAFAPLYFLSGELFSGDIRSVYDELTLPVWMCHGIRGDFTDYRQETDFDGRPNWRVSIYPTGALPQFEIPDAFAADYDAFLNPRAAG